MIGVAVVQRIRAAKAEFQHGSELRVRFQVQINLAAISIQLRHPDAVLHLVTSNLYRHSARRKFALWIRLVQLLFRHFIGCSNQSANSISLQTAGIGSDQQHISDSTCNANQWLRTLPLLRGHFLQARLSA